MKMLFRFKYINIVIIILFLTLTGCGYNNQPNQTIQASVEEQKPNIEIDTSELQVNGEGLELVGVEIEHNGGYYNVVASIKNNSNNDYEYLTVYVKLYDETGAVLDTRSDSGSKLGVGEVWKTQILISDSRDVSKIKLIEILARGSGNSSIISKDTLENTVIKCAKTLVYKNIKAPATAKWVSEEILDQDNYGRYLVNIVLDAQNGFGALIRNGFIVAIQSVQDDGQFTYSPMFFMGEYSTEFEKKQAIENIRSMNNWNEDKSIIKEKDTKQEKDIKQEDTAEDTIAIDQKNGDEIKITSWDAIIIVEEKTGFQYSDAYDISTGQYETEPESIQMFGTFCWIIPVVNPDTAMYVGELYVDWSTGDIYNESGDTPWR